MAHNSFKGDLDIVLFYSSPPISSLIGALGCNFSPYTSSAAIARKKWDHIKVWAPEDLTSSFYFCLQPAKPITRAKVISMALQLVEMDRFSAGVLYLPRIVRSGKINAVRRDELTRTSRFILPGRICNRGTAQIYAKWKRSRQRVLS